MTTKKEFFAMTKGFVSTGNSKHNHLGKRYNTQVIGFSVLSGKTCARASLCKAWVVESSDGSRTLAHGRQAEITCYKAKLEAVYRPVYEMAKQNTAMIAKDIFLFITKMNLILSTGYSKIVRIGDGGDIFTPEFYDAWVSLAKSNPDVTFFGYTKDVRYARRAQVTEQIDNLHLTYSLGGLDDSVAISEGLATATVVTDEFELSADGLMFKNHLKPSAPWEPMSCKVNKSDDYERIINNESFGMGLH